MLRSKDLGFLVFGLAIFSVFRCSPTITDSGKQLYEQHCETCHMPDGSGLRRLIPPIAHSDYLVKHRQQLPCLLKHGMEETITVNGQNYRQKMPGAENLTPDQVTNLLNFVQTNFGNKNERFTIPEVAAMLDSCAAHDY
ncbi:cytochrome c class I [Adhaeribacter arboris]|uniref:Cytochrome c class I n=1 Tax=Adhaeribacter arboris TaxID=2072846 RepID=A0A2T2YAN4_9BACT|nr:cytochrome c [Adhaeribacter arboris]PSR52564.1 cytochrome c class I [Adhaeribacter arboris]